MGFFNSILKRNNKMEVMNMETHTMAGHDHRPTNGTELAKDLVCGMDVDPSIAPAKSEHMGKAYYFCALGCKRAFDSNPTKFIEVWNTR